MERRRVEGVKTGEFCGQAEFVKRAGAMLSRQLTMSLECLRKAVMEKEVWKASTFR